VSRTHSRGRNFPRSLALCRLSLVQWADTNNEERLFNLAAKTRQGHLCKHLPAPPRRTPLYAIARQTDASIGNPSDLEPTLIALPSEKRNQVMLVLESVESRATTRADQELADAARLVRNVARRVWKHQDLDKSMYPWSESSGQEAITFRR
jgi:hypothetical protein